eukprot:768273-Hanusia_phi.AAC.6
MEAAAEAAVHSYGDVQSCPSDVFLPHYPASMSPPLPANLLLLLVSSVPLAWGREDQPRGIQDRAGALREGEDELFATLLLPPPRVTLGCSVAPAAMRRLASSSASERPAHRSSRGRCRSTKRQAMEGLTVTAGHVVLLVASLSAVQVELERELRSLTESYGRYQYPMLLPALLVLVLAVMWLLVSTCLGWSSNKAKLS